MALLPPPKNWKKLPIGKDERIWVYIMIVMLLMMGVMTVGYVFVGDQNPPEAYRQVPVDEFYQRAVDGNEASGATQVQINGVPGISLLEGVDSSGNGGDIFLVGRQWEWVAPQEDYTDSHGIQIKLGETYRLHIGSVDVLHGFQLIGTDFLISLQIVPGYEYILDFVPNETGIFRIICNEYCGAEHHGMAGFLQVVN